MRQSKPDYGFDGDPVALTLSVLAFAVIETALFLIPGKPFRIVGYILLPVAIFWLFLVIGYIRYVTTGKFQQRDAILSKISWKGDETVLDIGTGRGLLMIGAAKRLTAGKCIGIDIWRQEDMANNSPESTIQNAELEDVADKVEIRNEDIQKTSFQSSFFDVAVSNLCLHNIPTKEGQDTACREIVRILKPGGTIVIGDKKINGYYEVFKQEGLTAWILKSQGTRFPILVAGKE